MVGREKGRGRPEEADIIARMEAQFHEVKGPSADTEEEARVLWSERSLRGLHFGTVGDLHEDIEAVGLAPSGVAWRLVTAKGAPATERGAAIERWFVTRARERSQGNESGDVSRRLRRFIGDWASRVDQANRERFEVDLEYVLKRLALIFRGDQGMIWLESFNYNLNGRPIDVLREHGPAEVIVALDGEEQGAL